MNANAAVQIFVELKEYEDLLPGNNHLGITGKTIKVKRYEIRVPQCSLTFCTNCPVQASEIINHYLHQ